MASWIRSFGVIVELAALQKGTLINSGMINRALKNITKTLAAPVRNTPKDFVTRLADAGGNLLTSYFRNSMGQDKNSITESFTNLTIKIKEWIKTEERALSINRTAVAYGLVFSGMMKHVKWIAKKHKQGKDNTMLAINIALGLLGLAGHGVDKAASVVQIVSENSMKFTPIWLHEIMAPAF
jgi:hypothetical protein